MSNPQNNFQHDHAKDRSSYDASRPSSSFAPNWRSSPYDFSAHSHVLPNQAGAPPPPPSSGTFRSQIPVDPYYGYDAGPPFYFGEASEPTAPHQPGFHTRFPESEGAIAQDYDAFVEPLRFGPQQSQLHTGVEPEYGGLRPAEHTYAIPRVAPAVPLHNADSSQRTSAHDAPPAHRISRPTPGNAMPELQADAFSRRTERARRRLLNTQMNGAAHTAVQNRPQSYSAPQDSNVSTADVNVPAAPTAPPGFQYQYPARFPQPLPYQYQAPTASGMEHQFADAVEQRFFRNSLRPEWATSSSAMPTPSSDMSSDPHPRVHGSNFYEAATPISPSYLNPTGSGGASAMSYDMMLEFAQQNRHGDSDALLRMYESLPAEGLASGPQQHAEPNGTTGLTGSEELAALRARRSELLERRTREIRVLRARAHRAATRPPPAEVRHFTTLLAADTSHDVECPICQEPYDDDQHSAIQMQNVACTHVFGRGCLQEWCNSGMENAHKCPSCRQSLDGALGITTTRRRRSPDLAMPPRPGASRRGYDGYEGPSFASSRVREMDAMMAREGASQAQRDAFRQRMEGQILTPNPADRSAPLQPFRPAPAHVPAPPPSTQTPDRTQIANEQAMGSIRRALTFQRQQLARFDADAAHRLMAAEASGLREAHALTAQIAEERAAVVSRQEEQYMTVRELAMRGVQQSMPRDRFPRQE